LLFRAGGYAGRMDEKPETEQSPESDTASPEDGSSTERGEGPRDQPADGERLHGVPTDRHREEKHETEQQTD
jgi:hypothetical protein